MIIKKREKSLTLCIMESLSCRMKLSNIHSTYLRHLRKGHVTELDFDDLAAVVSDEVLVFNDLLLQPRLSNAFQWDTVFLAGRTFYLHEIKSAGGEYRYGPETFVSKTGFEMKNPLIQMQENKNNFKLFLRELGYDKEFQVEAYSVLLNPSLTLYNLPEEAPILLRSQLQAHFEKVSRSATPLTNFHRKVVRDLLAHQGKPKAFWEHIPAYGYGDLAKGVPCPACQRFGLQYSKLFAFCAHCDAKHQIRSIIEKLIDEYRHLFPDQKVTSQIIHRWSGGAFPVRRIKRVMNEYLSKERSQ